MCILSSCFLPFMVAVTAPPPLVRFNHRLAELALHFLLHLVGLRKHLGNFQRIDHFLVLLCSLFLCVDSGGLLKLGSLLLTQIHHAAHLRVENLLRSLHQWMRQRRLLNTPRQGRR